LEKEKKIGLEKTAIYKNFEKKINYLKKEILILLDNLQKRGKRIFGYGASNTTTTLLFHFEIHKHIQCIIDDNKIKIGRFSPYYHIPVVSSEIIYKEKPDYIFLFAWRFSEIIIKKHKKYLQNGGKFIIPLPELKVIG